MLEMLFEEPAIGILSLFTVGFSAGFVIFLFIFFMKKSGDKD